MLETVSNVIWWLLSILGLILLIVSYTYINKLEKIDCRCAEHPYRKFIKNYIIFAIVFLLILMIIPASKAGKIFGQTGALVYAAATLLFTVASIVFFVYALMYVRYLMMAKCMCSEDMRRDALYIWSIAEIVILGIIVVIPLIAILAVTTIGLIVGGVKQLSSASPSVIEAVSNPFKSAKRLPSTLRRELKALSRA
jgi:hypothetical protein